MVPRLNCSWKYGVMIELKNSVFADAASESILCYFSCNSWNDNKTRRAFTRVHTSAEAQHSPLITIEQMPDKINRVLRSDSALAQLTQSWWAWCGTSAITLTLTWCGQDYHQNLMGSSAAYVPPFYQIFLNENQLSSYCVILHKKCKITSLVEVKDEMFRLKTRNNTAVLWRRWFMACCAYSI